MRTVILVLATIYAVYTVLITFGVFDVVKSNKQAVSIYQTSKKQAGARKKEIKKLKFYSDITSTFRGILLSPVSEENHLYYINRLDIRSDILNRLYTVDELVGRHVAPFLMSLLLIPVCIFFPLCWLYIGYRLFKLLRYRANYRMQIYYEDVIIDNYFNDLYTMLYAKLKHGSRSRIQGTVQSYIDTLDTQFDPEVRKVMTRLGKHLLNLLSFYEDHVAVMKLKEYYHSATIINFCNVATQALRGIDNIENLFSFKEQLIARKTDMMRKRSNIMVAKGQRSIWVIWIILFIFVGFSFYNKVVTSF